MMTVSVASLLIPAAFHATFPGEDLDEVNTLKISRASSIILLIVYISYLHPLPPHVLESPLISNTIPSEFCSCPLIPHFCVAVPS